MKPLPIVIAIILLSCSIQTQSQQVTYTPLNAGFENRITIHFNLNLSTGDKRNRLLNRKEPLYLWMGAGINDANAFEYTPATQVNFNEPVEGGKLISLGENHWEITVQPTVYCNIPTTKKITILALIVKNADGSAQTETMYLKTGAAVLLKEVAVFAKKPFVEQEIDKTIINVQSDINAMASSAFEILQKAPGISINGDDMINMSGKWGVNVMIDGRPTQMSSKALANYLRGLPGNTIEKIELITNPSSRYDAQGNAGMINIRLKKNKVAGTNGNIAMGYTQSDHYRTNGSFNINHRMGKVNLFANGGMNHNLQFTEGYIDRYIKEGNGLKNFYNQTVDKDQTKSYQWRSGIDFYMNKKNTFGFIFQWNNASNPFSTPGTTFMSSNGKIDSSLITQNDNVYRNKRFNSNLNYKYEDSIGNEWNVDADITYFWNSNGTQLSTSYLDNNNTKYRYTANHLLVATIIPIFSLKADYIKQLKQLKAKLETGVKWSKVNTDNNLLASFLSGNQFLPDTGRTNRFRYQERIFAVYMNYGAKWKKWEYQLGLRNEYALISGVSTNIVNESLNNPDTSYINLFPSIFVGYRASEKNRFAFSYSKRINRPDYQNLNPFETIYDIYTSEKGNPYLRPQYTNNLELKYIYRDALNIAMGVNHTKDYSQTISTQKGTQTTATTANIGTLDNLYLTISSPLPIAKWWDGYINITGFFNHYKGQLPDGIMDEKVFGMNYYVQQHFNPGKQWTIQLSSWFNAATKEAIFKSGSLGSVDLGVKKLLLQSKASIRLSIIDIFNTQRWRQSVDFGLMQYTYYRKWESRGLRLQWSWNFGKTSFKARERDTHSDAQRIKTKA